VIDVGPSNGQRRQIHITAATVAAVSSVLGILVYAIGFVSGALVLKSNVDALQAGNIEIRGDLKALRDQAMLSREEESVRLTKLESKLDYTTQGIADLKALRAGTNR
jgi:hypothetical protein